MLYETEKIKQRELKTLNRFETANRTSTILTHFFNNGFKSFESFKSIILNYHPEITDKKLWDFWHFRIIDIEICDKVIYVFDKLKEK